MFQTQLFIGVTLYLIRNFRSDLKYFKNLATCLFMVCDDAGMAKKCQALPSHSEGWELGEDYFSQFFQTSIDLDRAILFIEIPIPGRLSDSAGPVV